MINKKIYWRFKPWTSSERLMMNVFQMISPLTNFEIEEPFSVMFSFLFWNKWHWWNLCLFLINNCPKIRVEVFCRLSYEFNFCLKPFTVGFIGFISTVTQQNNFQWVNGNVLRKNIQWLKYALNQAYAV